MPRQSQQSQGTDKSNRQFFKTYHHVLAQKKKFDDELVSMQEKLLEMLQSGSHQKPSAPKRRGRPSKKSKEYVPRMDNNLTLVEAIRSVMVPGQEMKMKEILDKLVETGAYKTKSSKLYTMVNNKLNRDTERISTIRRGVFVLDPTPEQKKEIRQFSKKKESA